MSAMVAAALCVATGLAVAVLAGWIHRRRLAQWRADEVVHLADTHRRYGAACADAAQARADLAAAQQRHEERLATLGLEVGTLARISAVVRPHGLERLYDYPVVDAESAARSLDQTRPMPWLADHTQALPTLDGAR